jgi:TonB family protein
MRFGLSLACSLLIAAGLCCSRAPKHPAPPEEQEYLPSPNEFIPYDEPPVQLNEVSYQYPPGALVEGIEGTVWVKVLVDRNGKVRDAFIFEGSGTDVGFEETVLEQAHQVVYEPAMSEGRPVAVWALYPVKFSIKSKSPKISTPHQRAAPPKGQKPFPTPEEFRAYSEPPVPLNEIEYEYPVVAFANEIEGTVYVKALIDSKGQVRDALIHKGSGTNVGFEDVALQGAYRIRYKPAIYEGKPVAVWVVYPVRFSIRYKSK